MKKKLFLFFLPLSLNVSAQYVVTGKVLDRYGNPISGAKVEGIGTSGQTVTDFDGFFELETPRPIKKVKASFTGMESRKAKAENGMEMRLRTTSWFNKIEKGTWFVGPTWNVPVYNEKSFGLMAGWVKRFGLYIRGAYDFGYKGHLEDYKEGHRLTGKYQATAHTISGGVIIRPLKCLSIYGGIGGLHTQMQIEGKDKEWYIYETPSRIHSEMNLTHFPDYSGMNFMGELGLMFMHKHFFVSGGVNLSGFVQYEYNLISGHVSAGICF